MTLANVRAARPDALESELQDFLLIVEDVEPAKQGIADAYDHFVEAWEDSWNWWRRSVVDRDEYDEEKRAVEGIWETIEQTRLPDGGDLSGSVIEIADRVINHHYPVISLFRTSSRWVTETYTPVSNIYADIWNPERSRDLAGWGDGAARGAYDEIRQHQQSSVEAMVGIAGDISVWLSDVATGNVEFTTSLLSVLGDIANTLIGETGKFTNTAGLGVIWASAEVIGAAVQGGLDALGIQANSIAAMASRIIEADRIIGDHSHFPDGHWPEAVSRT